MRFGPDESQQLLGDSLERLLAEAVPLERVRRVAGGDEPVEAIDASIAPLGLDGMLVPEDHGGLGLAVLDAALVQETFGRHVTPSWRVAGATLAALALKDGSTVEAGMALAGIASREVRIAVALAEPAGRREGAGLRLEDGTVSGKAMFVLGAPGATHALAGTLCGALVLLPLDQAAVTCTALRSVDRTRCLHELQAHGATVLVASGSGADLARVLGAARVLMAADALGAAQAMLDRAVEYAGQRRQFGRPVGSFQAVKHLLAEMVAKLEPCRALVWDAAHALDAHAEDAILKTLLAKSHVSEVTTFVARGATEVHGGMGFTDLLGLHYWFKRVGADRQAFGGPVRLREEAARVQGWA